MLKLSGLRVPDFLRLWWYWPHSSLSSWLHCEFSELLQYKSLVYYAIKWILGEYIAAIIDCFTSFIPWYSNNICYWVKVSPIYSSVWPTLCMSLRSSWLTVAHFLVSFVASLANKDDSKTTKRFLLTSVLLVLYFFKKQSTSLTRFLYWKIQNLSVTVSFMFYPATHSYESNKEHMAHMNNADHLHD